MGKLTREQEVRELGEWDWWILPEGDRLHAAEVVFDPNYDPCGHGVTACGRKGWLSIPGLFSRMCAERCTRCCRNVGYPQGTGSPKNDKRCRALVRRRLRAARLIH